MLALYWTSMVITACIMFVGLWQETNTEGVESPSLRPERSEGRKEGGLPQ